MKLIRLVREQAPVKQQLSRSNAYGHVAALLLSLRAVRSNHTFLPVSIFPLQGNARAQRFTSLSARRIAWRCGPLATCSQAHAERSSIFSGQMVYSVRETKPYFVCCRRGYRILQQHEAQFGMCPEMLPSHLFARKRVLNLGCCYLRYRLWRSVRQSCA